MTLVDLASLGSFVSAIAVLISLIYLSLQVKQAERNQQASIRATRVTRIVDIYMRLAEPSLSDAVAKAGAGAVDLTDVEIRQFSFYCGARFYNAEDSFNQFQEGLLNQRSFDSLVVGLKNSLSQPGMRAFYKRRAPCSGKSSPISSTSYSLRRLSCTRRTPQRNGAPMSQLNWRVRHSRTCPSGHGERHSTEALEPSSWSGVFAANDCEFNCLICNEGGVPCAPSCWHRLR